MTYHAADCTGIMAVRLQPAQDSVNTAAGWRLKAMLVNSLQRSLVFSYLITLSPGAYC